ncbi:nitrite reductase/ring-hydroxylating ferredoxin subunit [Inhella inkyongensis]|uniref:Nitrite reductase/ring-hydroxylating ferredoxin subunit n=1 Tax=Inhella inkyongensis TaxID=392593 RepID=A0A840S7F5_9BURK|nr:Rieske 2Fe-2S domain-containing protein [Inhella inkyongensis]MBB5204379.1 nitrite reductase/ring-hydroxylating ferredoxin subunit [Inhella inkyongensis]
MAEAGLRVCRSEELLERGLGVQWELRYCGMEERAFALRIDGRVVAYLNRCAHVPTELDWQPNEFLDSERKYILCAVHGAVYSPATGACVMGRCGRAGLIPVAVAEVDGEVHWYPSAHIQPLPEAPSSAPELAPAP